jgi:crotonobetainyl-CoA:carnitine CoA-transferase CaiB-like acyl-CoA transferase
VILDGIRVLDFMRFTAGGFTTRWLASLGADVVKVEPPGGESLRLDGFEENPDGSLVASLYPSAPEIGGFGPMFLFNNLGKRSISIDMRVDGADALVRGLIASADVVAESFTPHVFKQWGYTYETLREIKPDIIFLSASGFGNDHPDDRRVCTEPIAMATSGFTYMNAEKGRYPVIDAPQLGDPLSGTVNALAVLGAIIHKLRTGEGQFIDTAMTDSVLAHDCGVMPYVAHSRGRFSPAPTGRSGNINVPMGVFAVGPGEFLVICANGNGPGSAWARLCGVMGREDLIVDPRWSTDRARRDIQPELWGLIEGWLARSFRTAEEAVESIASQQILAQKVASPNEALDNPDYKAREMYIEVEHPLVGSVPVIRLPIKYSRTPISTERAPLYGEHNERVLSEWLGYGETDITDLYNRGVISHDSLVEALRATGEIPSAL